MNMVKSPYSKLGIYHQTRGHCLIYTLVLSPQGPGPMAIAFPGKALLACMITQIQEKTPPLLSRQLICQIWGRQATMPEHSIINTTGQCQRHWSPRQA